MDIDQLTSLLSLASSLKDVRAITVYPPFRDDQPPSLLIQVATDSDVLHFANAHGVVMDRRERLEETKRTEWYMAEFELSGGRVQVMGPHHELVRADVTPETIA